MLKVQLRNGFSDRNEIECENKIIQYKDFEQRTRTTLINTVDFILNDNYILSEWYLDEDLQYILHSILSDLYCEKTDFDRRYIPSDIMEHVYQTIEQDSYDAVLTTIEFFANLISECTKSNEVYKDLNETFQEEYIGYRFIGKKITSITDEMEIQEIELAQEINIEPVKIHLDKALGYLSERTSPDYENSIKESISAVEAMCSSIVGKSDSLGKALNKLEQNGVIIHGALKTAFSQLYGWTSDANGIRHAGDIGGASSTFDEAKFMLVSCCAFINYLKSSMKD